MITVRIADSIKASGFKSIFVSFPYDTRVVDTIRSFPNRYWKPNTKEWELPLKDLGELTDRLADYDFDISGEYVSLDEPKAVTPIDFEFKTKPFQHQIDGFEFGLTHDRWLLGDEQGLGKTKQVIDIAVAKKYQKGYQHCLIICGVNGLKWNWQNEIKTHSNETGYILGQRQKKNKLVIGSTNDKLTDLELLLDAPESISDYFLITNIESIRNREICAEIASLCKRGIIGIVAVDEVHKCKNSHSQQGKNLLQIQPDCRIAMTGTPLMNTPLDLYIILKWLGYEKHSAYAFKQHYCVMGGYGGYEIVSYKNLNELQDQLKEIMLRRLKDDVLDLPDKLYIDEFVEMTPKQAQIYKEAKAEVMMNIDNVKMDNNPLAMMIRMRQATGYTGILSSTIQESAKLDRMRELVEESVENGKKVVIFSNWTQMTSVIQEKLSDYFLFGDCIITGETKDEDRQSMVEMFQTDPSCKVIIGTAGAMGTGLTLTAGTVVIFLDHPWTRASYDQCVDRTHRIGQKNNVTVYNLMCKDTIDEKIWDLVNRKGMLSDGLVDGKFDMSKSEIIDYLMS